MDQSHDVNFHFKRLMEGAPGDVMSQLGKALVAIHEQRQGAKEVDAPAALRTAWLTVARWLVRDRGADLNPEQRLFLLSGALADRVVVKSTADERVQVQLVDSKVYAALLADLDQPAPRFLLEPLRRMDALASGELAPLDLNRPGRYREPQAVEQRPADRQALIAEFAASLQELEVTKDALNAAIRQFIEVIQADRLKLVLTPAKELAELAAAMHALASDPAALVEKSVPAGMDHPAISSAEALQREIDGRLKGLAQIERDVLSAVRHAKASAAVISRAADEVGEELAPERLLVLSPEATKQVEKDIASVNGVIVQLLSNSPSRTTWSASRVLLNEHTEKYGGEACECYATPARLAASIAKIDKLHPNCFPHDKAGHPLLPPVIIEPGVGEARWYDDRFLLSFVCTEEPRRGSKLTLSPVDQAVLQLYGQFLARGDLYDYRGDRVTGNFAADYAGDVESKAKVKFTGAEKKMTIVSSTEVKDAAGREEAVRDYIDFVFNALNGLTIPKRINPRRIGVILRYCTIIDAQTTVNLALRYVAAHDPAVAREIILAYAGRNMAAAVKLIATALEADPQVAARYRKDIAKAVDDIMGREFSREAARKGALGKDAADAATGPADETEPGSGHDYFDV
ncbi:hypothetical protein JW859_07575 [bacterium]|nr:hypothetical protein [bacterium]